VTARGTSAEAGRLAEAAPARELCETVTTLQALMPPIISFDGGWLVGTYGNCFAPCGGTRRAG
jgi:hypothetical protein